MCYFIQWHSSSLWWYLKREQHWHLLIQGSMEIEFFGIVYCGPFSTLSQKDATIFACFVFQNYQINQYICSEVTIVDMMLPYLVKYLVLVSNCGQCPVVCTTLYYTGLMMKYSVCCSLNIVKWSVKVLLRWMKAVFKNSMFSFLHQLTTWYCSHLLLWAWPCSGWSISPACWAYSNKPAAVACSSRVMGQMGGVTPDSFIDLALHTMQSVSIMVIGNVASLRMMIVTVVLC